VIKTETVGDLFDKLCILEKRQQVFKNESERPTDVQKHLKEQKRVLLRYLSEIMFDVCNGDRLAEFKKYKIYDKKVATAMEDSFVHSIVQLNTITHELWDLEDQRRDRSLSDNERLGAADKISMFNKRRNDVIDHINEIFSIVQEEESADGRGGVG